MYLTEAHREELAALSESLNNRTEWIAVSLISRAVSDAHKGINTDYNLELLRAQNKLVPKSIDQWDVITDCVDVVWDEMKRSDTADFLTAEHVTAMADISDTWFREVVHVDFAERDAVCAFAYEDLLRVPSILNVISERKFYEAKDVIEMVTLMESSGNTALKEGVL